MAVPNKYKEVGTFHKYYSEELVAPVPTIFIGGNHEAASYLWELYYGGWVAPNIYFVGFAGAVRFAGLRLAGLSGIYNAAHFRHGHFEDLPYDSDTLRSIYHVRDIEIHRLLQLQEPIDVFMSHDWPEHVTDWGDTSALLRHKPDLVESLEAGTLGSPASWQLLQALRPTYWFSAHMHVRYEARVPHGLPAHDCLAPARRHTRQQDGSGRASGVQEGERRRLEANRSTRQSAAAEGGQRVRGRAASGTARGRGNGALGTARGGAGRQDGQHGGGGVGGAAGRRAVHGDEAGVAGGAQQVGARDAGSATRFLALDKCLPGRPFLEVLELDASGPPELHFDEEWLAVLRSTHRLLSLQHQHPPLPAARTGPRPEDVAFVRAALAARGTSRIPDSFTPTAPAFDPAGDQRRGRMPQQHVRNPQTVALLELLGLPYNLDHEAETALDFDRERPWDDLSADLAGPKGLSLEDDPMFQPSLLM